MTRKLAGALARRLALGGASSGAASALLHGGEAEAKKKGKGRGKKKGRRIDTTTLSYSQPPFSMTSVETAPRDPREATTRTLTVLEKEAVLLDLQSVAHLDGPVTYGTMFEGISRAQFTVMRSWAPAPPLSRPSPSWAG